MKGFDLAASLACSKQVISSDRGDSVADVDGTDGVFSGVVGDTNGRFTVCLSNVSGKELVACNVLVSEDEVDCHDESLLSIVKVGKFDREDALIKLSSVDVDNGPKVLESVSVQ